MQVNQGLQTPLSVTKFLGCQGPRYVVKLAVPSFCVCRIQEESNEKGVFGGNPTPRIHLYIYDHIIYNQADCSCTIDKNAASCLVHAS